ncbi:MAG: PEP-CTERM sorting domain-containing protein [Pirellulales bacterium]|nr:PEP-CTERM sorting domain-containing protein [Pirellulales bacterium]
MRSSPFVFVAALLVCGISPPLTQGASISDFNVVWTTPSTNSNGSMPLGNGDIGVNVWTENGRDLVFYLSKTDSWDDNGSLLKLGKVRVTLPTNSFLSSSFKQELRLQDGTIQIDAGTGSSATTIKLWIDPSNPVVQIDVQRASAFNTTVTYEPWRTTRRELTGQETQEAYSEKGGGPIYVEPDTTVTGLSNQVRWYHRNTRSVWASNLTVQGLDPNNTVGTDPLINNTFGASITGDNLSSINSTRLTTTQPTTHQTIAVHALTAQTDTVQEWNDQLNQAIAATQSTSYDQRKTTNDQHWNDFADQSYIRITGGPGAATVSQGYALQRYMNASAGQGGAPIKFNGSIFTVDTYNRSDLGDNSGYNADYRRWGGAYWWQNTRFPYYSMMASGDFSQMQPLFDMYVKNLAIAKERVKTYYGPNAQGAYFPEVMNPWGTWTSYDYGQTNPNPQSGVATNNYIRYEWQGGLELSAMMLQYYDYTGDSQFVRDKLVPLASEIVTFYDTHYPRDASGKLQITPAQALETYWTAVNPQPEIAGLTYVLDKLLQLPESETTPELRAQWARLQGELPSLPTRTVNGKVIFSPGETFSNLQNYENPELYGVFPYQLSGVGKDNLQMGIDTYNNRGNSLGAYDWSQDPIDAAMLGLSAAAQQYVIQAFSNKDSGSRFPGFYGPNYDWLPEQDQANVASIALQRMLLQVDGDEMILFPAWPSDWDAQFKLFGSKNRIVMGEYKDGAVQWMDPLCDGDLTQDDYLLVLAHLGYSNGEGKGDLESLLLGDVNLDGFVNDADRTALLAGAAGMGIDTSGWLVPEPGTAVSLATGLLGGLAWFFFRLRRRS